MVPRIPFNLHAGTGLLQFNLKTRQFVKRNAESGRFMDVKQNGTPFKGGKKGKVDYLDISIPIS